MLQKEFENLTQFEVSAEEFEAINVVYMNSDLEKEDFCKKWCEMNAVRIHDAWIKEARAKKHKKDLAVMYNKISKMARKYRKIIACIKRETKRDNIFIDSYLLLSDDDYNMVKDTLGIDLTISIHYLCKILEDIVEYRKFDEAETLEGDLSRYVFQ